MACAASTSPCFRYSLPQMESIQEALSPGLGIPVTNRLESIERELELSDARQQLLRRRLEAVEFSSSHETGALKMKVAQVEQQSPAELFELFRDLKAEIDRIESAANRGRQLSTYFLFATFLVLLVNTAMLVCVVAGVRL